MQSEIVQWTDVEKEYTDKSFTNNVTKRVKWMIITYESSCAVLSIVINKKIMSFDGHRLGETAVFQCSNCISGNRYSSENRASVSRGDSTLLFYR